MYLNHCFPKVLIFFKCSFVNYVMSGWCFEQSVGCSKVGNLQTDSSSTQSNTSVSVSLYLLAWTETFL